MNNVNRNKKQLFPEYSAEIEAIEKNGISEEILHKIIAKHKHNALYNRKLYNRYMVLAGSVPIFEREPRFNELNPINNKINNDFFGEIVDFKTGYFAGKPITYSYSKGEEAQQDTGGEEAVKTAARTVTDFTTRNNMYGCDMDVTKLASICGYSGRLFYIDKDGNERCMPTIPYETIVLSNTNIAEPEYAVRYFSRKDIDGVKTWTAEFYDNQYVYFYKGGSLGALKYVKKKLHCFDYCPLQGIANNKELMGDAEKVLAAIDDYDKVISDNSNEIESFVHAYLIFEGMRIDDEEIEKGKQAGSFKIPHTGTQQGKAYFLTKNINDNFTEHHLKRIEDNIYRFSKTPNLNDVTFGSASGVSLKFKLHGLETKCGMFQAKMQDAAQYMWKVLASSWDKRKITVDPLHVTMDFKRNFPLDIQNEAQAAQVLIAAGMPKEFVYSQLSFVDDVDDIMEKIEAEQGDVASLYETKPDDTEPDNQGEDEDQDTDDKKEKK